MHVDDIQPLYDVSGVQAYCINSRRAVLIHPKVRPGSRGEEVLWLDGDGDLKEARPECMCPTQPPSLSSPASPPPLPLQNVEKEQKCPAFDHACMGCQKPLRADCTYCSLRCKVDVEYGFAPITPKGSAAMRDGAAAVVMAAAAAAVLQPSASRPTTQKKRPAYTAAAAAAVSSLDVSHATWCSSGGEAGSSRGKRRKAERPERSYIS